MLPQLLLQLGTHAIDHGDTFLQTYVMDWEIESLCRDPAGLFDAPFLFPCRNTLAFHDTTFAALLFGVPIRLLTGDALITYHLCLVLTFFLTGVSGYLLVYHIVGRHIPAVLGGAAFAFSSFRFAEMTLNMLSMQWIPVCLLFLHLVIERGRWYHWAGLFASFVLNTLSSWYHGFHLSLLVLVAGGCGLLLWNRKPRSSDAVPAAIGTILSVLIVLPLAMPHFAVARAFPEAPRTIDTAMVGSAFLEDFLAPAKRNLLYGHLVGIFRPPTGPWRPENEHALFPGLVVLVFAAVGVLSSGRDGGRRYVLVYVAAGAASFLFALGPALKYAGEPRGPVLPYALAYHLVPGLDADRFPARFSVGVQLALCVLAAIGCQRVLEGVASHGKRTTAAFLGALFVGLAMFENYCLPVAMREVERGERLPEAYKVLAKSEAPGALLELTPTLFGYGGFDEHMPMYYQRFHKKPVYNGLTAFVPRAHDSYREGLREFPEKDSIRIMQQINIRYVLLHLDALPEAPGERAAMVARIRAIRAKARHVAGLRVLYEGADDILYLVPDKEVPRTAGVQLRVRAPTTAASGRPFTAWAELAAGTLPVSFLADDMLFVVGVFVAASGGAANRPAEKPVSVAARIRSPGLIMPGRTAGQWVELTAPPAGTYSVRWSLATPEGLLTDAASGSRIAVRDGLPASTEADRLDATIQVREPTDRILTGRLARFQVTIVNNSDVLWRAAPKERLVLSGLRVQFRAREPYRFSLPAKVRRGAARIVAWWAMTEEERSSPERVAPWLVSYFNILNDLGPKDSYSTGLILYAPPDAGSYRLCVSVEVLGRPSVRVDRTGACDLPVEVGER